MRLTALLLISCFALVLAGCSGGTETSTGTTTTTTTTTATGNPAPSE